MSTPSTRLPISFEFFPPNTPVGSDKLRTTVA
jgi:5,10-methylenetetrahydrofolate reductase